MDRKELLKMRRDVLKEVQSRKEKLLRLEKIISDYKNEQTLINKEDIIKSVMGFLDGAEEVDRVESYLKTYRSDAVDIGPLLGNLEEIRKSIHLELNEKNESIRSIERYLFRLLFEELKSELYARSKDLIEKIVVVRMNSGLSGLDYNVLFADIFGEFQHSPSQERRRSIEEEVKAQW